MLWSPSCLASSCGCAPIAVGAQAGEASVEFALHAGAAKAQQGAQEGGQRQLAGAGEGLGVIGAAGHLGKGRTVQVIGKIGQNVLRKITVLRQNSCQPRKTIKQNQRLANCTSLSSVDWVDGCCPIALRLGTRGYCLELDLRAGRQRSARESEYSVECALGTACAVSAAPLLLRADSGFCSQHPITQTLAQAARLGRRVDLLLQWNPRIEYKFLIPTSISSPLGVG